MAEHHREVLACGAQVLAVANDTTANARAYFRRHNIPFPCLVDTGHRVFDQYCVESRLLSLGQRPALFVIDSNGIVRYAHIGWQQWDIPTCEKVLAVCWSISARATLGR